MKKKGKNMIISGIGTDIEKVSRFKKYEKDDKFIARIFTEKEIEYCYSKKNFHQHLAGRFCAKEAFIKASQDKTIPMNKIEILNKENGAPFISVLNKDFKDKIHVSISHTTDVAQAFVIIEKAP